VKPKPNLTQHQDDDQAHQENQIPGPIFEFTVTPEHRAAHERLDLLLTQLFPLSRSTIKKLSGEKAISANSPEGQAVELSLNKVPPAGTLIKILAHPPKDEETKAAAIPFHRVYEDNDIVVIDKHAGLVIHPGANNEKDTLLSGLLAAYPELLQAGEAMGKRPGIVHRLDKGTTGIMVCAKNLAAQTGLMEQFKTHSIKRQYQAICIGPPVIPPAGIIRSTIGRDPKNRLRRAANTPHGKEAITHYRVQQANPNFGLTHLELTLETGRTHQIRVHVTSFLNCPILGDTLYRSKHNYQNKLSPELKALMSSYSYPLLHAKFLGFTHPITKKYCEFRSEPPEVFRQALALAFAHNDG
jgi:23S rRNA pseudouridine1911/1915/1917 synthase